MGWFYDFIRLGLDVVEARIPFRLLVSIINDPPTVAVNITNHTKSTPLVIQSVRIHFGHPDYTYAFVLSPDDTQKIEAHDSKQFLIQFELARIQRRITRDLDGRPIDSYPSFDGPADLFRAIANGPRRSSWIEIDFNEFRQRRFRRGKMKRIFAETLKIGIERHKNRG